MIISFVENPTGSSDNKVMHLEKIRKAGLDYRKQREQQWRTNILFLRGRQWEEAVLTPNGTRRMPFAAPHSKVKMVSNQLYPLARQASAALVDNISQPIASPATMEPMDVYAAEIATDLLVYRQYEDNEVEKRTLETIWAMVCGLVLRMTYFDPEAESNLQIGKVMGAGDIKTLMLNPWQFCLSPWAQTAQESEWICLSDVRPIEEINDIYKSDVKEESCAAENGLNERDMMGLIEDSHGGGGNSFQKLKNAAILHRMYIKPTMKNPKGQVFTWSNGVLLKDNVELPEGEMPFVPIQWFPTPGSPYPLPFISPLIDLQKEINITLSQLIELKNRQLRGDLLVRGSAMPTEEYEPVSETIDDTTGRKIVYADATVQDMKFFEYNLDVSNAEKLIARLFNDAMQIAGIHESSMGMQQPAGTPATTTLALKESDHSGLTPFRQGFNIAHAKIGRQKIIIAKNHYKVPRINRIVGEGNTVKTAAFVGSDLRSTEDVRPQTTPMLTETEKNTIKSQLMAQLFQMPNDLPKDILARVRVIQFSGLPDAEAMAEKECAPLSIEELEQIVGEIRAANIKLVAAQTQAMLEQATAPPEEAQDDPMSQLPPEAQMVMGMAQGQQQVQQPQ